MSETVFEKAREEAEDLAQYDQPLDIAGSDIDPGMVEIAQQNANEAGLGGIVTFKQMQVADFTAQEAYGTIRQSAVR